MLSFGIIGLPNVGKSTLFNALTAGQADVSNYPFTTIDSNIGVVPVPDPRLDEFKRILKPKECTPCFIQFIDIAGLVEGASKGEGLGNQFLGKIRQVDAIAHVVRCFGEPEVAHVFGEMDPVRDVEIVEAELLLADLDLLSRALEKRQRIWKTNPSQYAEEQERWSFYQEKLEGGIPLRLLRLDREAQQDLKAVGVLTGKPVLFVANLSEEEEQDEDHPCAQRLKESLIAQQTIHPPEVVTVSAKIEWELQQLEVEERTEFMRELGIVETGLRRLLQKAYLLLELITFYTVVHEKLQAWAIPRGTRASLAAGKIHSEMEQGFIRAQVVSSEALRQHGSFAELQSLGLVRTEGKDYAVQDGDVIEFLFSSPW